MNQDYAIVSYDLAVALKAFSIQALQRPLFDNLIILLGNFHVEMAFYAAVGTFIEDSASILYISWKCCEQYLQPKKSLTYP